MSESGLVLGTIDLTTDLESFFVEAVVRAKEQLGCSVSVGATRYVAGILTTSAVRVPDATGGSEPLSIRVATISSLPPREAFERLRQLGDELLYACGYFSEHLERRGLSRSYAEQLGSDAYARAERMLAVPSASPGTGLFHELAEGFRVFVQLVRAVADSLGAASARSNEALLSLYERWLRSGSAPLAAVLAGRGLLASRGPVGSA